MLSGIAVAAVSLLGLAFGCCYASRRLRWKTIRSLRKLTKSYRRAGVVAVIPAVAPYAEAISCNGEKINRCAPGGEAVMLKIAELLNVEPQPLDGEAQELTPARWWRLLMKITIGPH